MRRLLVLVAFGAAPFAQAQTPAPAPSDVRPLFDGRADLRPAAPTAAEAALVRRLALPTARAHWRAREPGVEEAFEVLDATRGAFTAAGANQRAVLYRYARVPRCCIKQGVAVLDGDRVVAHVAFESETYAVGRAADLDGNGVDELLLAGGGSGQGTTMGSLAVLDLSGGRARSVAWLDTSDDDCAAGNPTGMHAARILVRRGPTPQFFREPFASPCGPARWRPAGGRAPVEAQPQADLYARLPVR